MSIVEMVKLALYGMDSIPVLSGDVVGVTNDVDVGAARILRRPINRVDGMHRSPTSEAVVRGRSTDRTASRQSLRRNSSSTLYAEVAYVDDMTCQVSYGCAPRYLGM